MNDYLRKHSAVGSVQFSQMSDWQIEMIKYNAVLMANERNNGRTDVYDMIEKVFSADGAFNGRIQFNEADDLIREIKLRLAEKDKDEN